MPTKQTVTKRPQSTPSGDGVLNPDGTINNLDLPRRIYPNADGTDPSPLTDEERQELKRCERLVGRALISVFEAGEALIIIRDRKLYKGTHDTFEDYCRDRWHIGKSHSYRLIGAAFVKMQLSPVGDDFPKLPQPISESQVRPLVGLPQEDVIKIWKSAAAEAPKKRITARLVSKKLAELRTQRGDSLSGRQSNRSSRSNPAAGISLSDVLVRVELAMVALTQRDVDAALACLEQLRAQLPPAVGRPIAPIGSDDKVEKKP
jgi:hypothetical protein